MKKNIKTVLIIAVIASTALYLLLSGFDDSAVYYMTVKETLDNRIKFEKQPVRVNGLLKPGSIKQQPNTDNFKFILQKNKTSLTVIYSGILPDNMIEGKELVVEGTLIPKTDTLKASQILTKCPSKYEKEAQDRNK